MKAWTAIIAALVLGAMPALVQAHTAGGQGGVGRNAHDQRPGAGHTKAHGKGTDRGQRGKARIAYVARGTVTAVEVQAQTITITVADRRGATNRHARDWRGTDVTFDVSSARLRVADVNGDGARDLSDVTVGDRAKILAKLPRRLPFGQDAAPAVFKAKRVVVRHPVSRTPADEPAETPAGQSDS